MTAITKYRASDGTEFTEEDQCEAYEAKCFAVDISIAQFPERPDSCDFANGKGYIQHDRGTFLKVRRELLQLADQQCPHKWITQSLADEGVHSSWAGRWISEAGTRSLYLAWYRIICTDADLREWGQPYYAMNPTEASGQFQVNP